jgi:hypothetical protein
MDLTDAQALITAGIGLVEDFSLTPYIAASALVGLAMYLFRRAKSAAR